ncbi:MAG: heterodisulfide reductase-related iron-sulfur binding cluster [Planctomycetota bacterium]|nr:heterodisulfide reductase-related iron-sulfur binding cluster [Planctomycetota bacterium]
MKRYDIKSIAYYPGCTLRNGAEEVEKSFLYLCDALFLRPDELRKWNCCGTVFSLQQDALVYHLASLRNFIRAKEAGKRALLAPCSVCYNTLAQVLEFCRKNPESLRKANEFMYEEETKFNLGDVDVLDIVVFLRDVVGYECVAEAAKRNLDGLKISVYYGCLHSRPRSVATCEVEMPNTLEQLLLRLGASCVEYSMKNECCGSYLVVKDRAIALERVMRIVRSATCNGAELLVTLCPLCYHNLSTLQKEVREEGFKPLPVVYLTQVLAFSLGAPKEIYNPKSAPIPAFAS